MPALCSSIKILLSDTTTTHLLMCDTTGTLSRQQSPTQKVFRFLTCSRLYNYTRFIGAGGEAQLTAFSFKAVSLLGHSRGIVAHARRCAQTKCSAPKRYEVFSHFTKSCVLGLCQDPAPKDDRKEGGRGRDTRQWVNEAKN